MVNDQLRRSFAQFKLIIDILDLHLHTHEAVPARLWWLLAAEFGLAVLSSVVTRMIDYSDALLANKYTRHVSIQVMKHASALDLTAYEDPVFYDRLERARVQATDRLVMIQSIGRLQLQLITAIGWSVAVMIYSPWLMLLLVAAVLPAFMGETHFAFLGYAKNFRQTPIKRQLDYLRQAGATKEAAKELKLFSLSRFFTERFARLSDIIYQQDVDLAKRRLGVGSGLSFVSTAGYYGAYAYVIWRTLSGRWTIGTFYFLSTAILQASSNIQQVFSTLSGIADQALFLTDLLAFFEMKPTIRSKPNALPAPRGARLWIGNGRLRTSLVHQSLINGESKRFIADPSRAPRKLPPNSTSIQRSAMPAISKPRRIPSGKKWRITWLPSSGGSGIKLKMPSSRLIFIAS